MITLGGIVEDLLASALGTLIHRGYNNLRYVKLRIYRPSLEIRVSFSAILRISKGDKYLLVRNLHRKETFGPFGGVLKYFENAIPDLDKLDFRPQVIGQDMERDLRGFLPRRNLTKLISWYNKRTERESYSECLLRELREETAEADLPNSIVCPTVLNFRLVRRIIENPKYLKPISCYQYRVFEVYDVYPVRKDIEKFVNRLFSQAKTHKNLLVVSQDEIIRGRANSGEIIGPHTLYFFSQKRNRADDPMFVRPRFDK